MKTQWDPNELVEHFTLTEAEFQLMVGLAPHNQVGLALLLKIFNYQGRFPAGPQDIPDQIIDFVTDQLGFPTSGIYHIRRIWDMASELRLDRHDAASISDLIQVILNHSSALQAVNPMHGFVFVSHFQRMW